MHLSVMFIGAHFTTKCIHLSGVIPGSVRESGLLLKGTGRYPVKVGTGRTSRNHRIKSPSLWVHNDESALVCGKKKLSFCLFDHEYGAFGVVDYF